MAKSEEEIQDSSKLIAEKIRQRRKIAYTASAIAATLVSLTVLVALAYYLAAPTGKEPEASDSPMGTFRNWTVVTDVDGCRLVPREMFMRNGTLADAAVATLLCMSIYHPYASGIGGGFVALYYHGITTDASVLIATESAPGAALREKLTNSKVLRSGWTSIGVPGEIYGYSALLSRIGSNVPWSDLFADAISKSEHGIVVDKAFGRVIVENRDAILAEESLKKLLWNRRTRDLYQEGEVLRNPELSSTLRLLAKGSYRDFYNRGGTVAGKLINDLRIGDGNENFVDDPSNAMFHEALITADDLTSYRAKWKPAMKVKLDSKTALYTAPLPSGGATLAYIMNIMAAVKEKQKSANIFKLDLQNLHYMVEAFKFALNKRMLLGDDSFVDVRKVEQEMTSQRYAEKIMKRIHPDGVLGHNEYGEGQVRAVDHGTSLLAIVTRRGDALVVTSSLHSPFGSLRITRKTGILMNNALSDFNELEEFARLSDDAVIPANSLAPFKRPLSSLSPSVFVTDDSVMLALAGTGGLRIPTSQAQVALRFLWENRTLKSAIDYPRLHVDVKSGSIQYEHRMIPRIMYKMAQKGHTLDGDPEEMSFGDRYSCVCGIAMKHGVLYTNADFRAHTGGFDGD